MVLDELRLGMGGSGAIVASHLIQLVIAILVMRVSAGWLLKRWRSFLDSDVGLLILSGFVASLSRICQAAVYGMARLIHHETGLSVWADLHWITGPLRTLPILAGLLFLAGCWRLLSGLTCDELRKPFVRLLVALGTVWLVATYFLS